jgi:precorrin-4/cobalt-precorrin-4 C11-methyltransferase
MTVHFIGAGPGAADLITDARPRSYRALSGLPLCRLDRAARIAYVLSAGRAHRRYRAAFARRDRCRVRRGPCRRSRRGAASFRRSFDLLGARRATAPARAARHTLYADARRAGLRRRSGGPGMRADRAGSRAKRGADARPGRASRMPESEKLATFAASGATLVDPSGDPRHREYRARADAILRRRLSGGGRRAGELAHSSASCAARSPTSPQKSPPARIERTALILVGRALAAQDFRDSALYDADYRRRFRGGAA